MGSFGIEAARSTTRGDLRGPEATDPARRIARGEGTRDPSPRRGDPDGRSWIRHRARGRPLRAGGNRLGVRKSPDLEPNDDTPYSVVGMDLRAEPLVLCHEGPLLPDPARRPEGSASRTS